MKKGLLLKFLSVENRMDEDAGGTVVTYRVIETEDPGEFIWNRMAEDLKHIYQDDHNYGIYLESSNIDCPVPKADSWGGYCYQWSTDEMAGWIDTEVRYVFIESTHE